MVYINLSEDVHLETATETHRASAFSRFFSALLDYFILAPVITFVMVIFFRDSVKLITHISDSSSQAILFQLAFFAAMLFTGVQTAFIYLYGATPGQNFLKLYITFEQKPSNLFFQIWFRQLGFAFSVLCLGLPFLAVVYHKKHRTFYDRLAECDVVSTIPEARGLATFTVHDTDKKYLSATVSAVMCFISFIFIFTALQSHDVLLEKSQITAKASSHLKKCFVIEDQNQQQRLKTVLALNILNLTSDDCALSEADEVLNRVKVSQKEGPPKAENVSMAYFVKFYVGQKTAERSLNQAEYFKYACNRDVKADLCAAVKVRDIASENKKVSSSKNLNDKLLEFIGRAK